MKCPICNRPAPYEGNPYRPFCSERCKLIDFGAWVNEEYTVPAEEKPPPPEDSPQGTDTIDEQNRSEL